MDTEVRPSVFSRRWLEIQLCAALWHMFSLEPLLVAHGLHRSHFRPFGDFDWCRLRWIKVYIGG